MNEMVDRQASPSPSEGGEIPYISKEFGYMMASPTVYSEVKDLQDHAKKNSTQAESLLWNLLRSKKIGHKIRRQHVIDVYIVDFVCLTKRVVIEVDGEVHDSQKDHDELRSEKLNALGFEVIRFTNEQVFFQTDYVVKAIKNSLDKSKINITSNNKKSPSFGGVGGGSTQGKGGL